MLYRDIKNHEKCDMCGQAIGKKKGRIPQIDIKSGKKFCSTNCYCAELEKNQDLQELKQRYDGSFCSRKWPPIYRAKIIFDDFIYYTQPDFREDKRTCKWCGDPLKSARQTSLCSDECRKNWDRYALTLSRPTYPLLIIYRDNFRCQKCGKSVAWVNEYRIKVPFAYDCDVHHIVPLKDGGDNSQSNLQTLCSRCHKEIHKS